MHSGHIMTREERNDIPRVKILGTLDCSKVNLCRLIVEELMKTPNSNAIFEFILAFETPFEQYRDELLKENTEFLKFSSSPIIYIETNKKELIGSMEEFQKYVVVYYGYYENRKEGDFTEINKQSLRNFMKNNGNRYCYLLFSIGNKIFEEIVIELFNNEFPKTCENFFNLCKGVGKNSKNEKLTYQNTIINRVVRSGYIQGGDLTNLSGSKSIYDGEFADEGYTVSHSYPGVLGMVKKGKRKHSNECQFYITLTTLKSFDNMFVAFGRVIKGFKTIKEIENVETSLQRPTSLIKITKCGEYLV